MAPSPDSTIHSGDRSNRRDRRAAEPSFRNWGAALLPLAGSVGGLPSDFAVNHDYYLHGASKIAQARKRRSDGA